MRLTQDEAREKARVKALGWSIGDGLTDGYLTVGREADGFTIQDEEAGDMKSHSVELEDAIAAIVQINGYQSEDW